MTAETATRPGHHPNGIVDQGDQPAPVTSRRAVFAVVSAGVVMANLDLLIVNVAVPNIQRDFAGDSLADLSWVLNGYAIVFAALLVPAGRMSDRFGPKTSFLMGVALFTFASALCALSTGVAMLIGARCLQAAGAAAMVPTSLALLMGTYPPEKRSTAIRLWAAVGGVAAALGPVVGGLLVTISWRWVFLINLPIGIVTVLAGRRVLRKSPVLSAGRLPDLFGALVLLAAIGLLSLGIVKAPEWGWLSASVFGCIGVGVALIWVFLLRSAHHPSPIVAMHLWRIRSYSAAAVASLLFSVAFAAMLLSAVLWMQDAWQWSGLRTGFAIAPGPAMLPILAVAAAPLARKVGPGVLAAVGSLALAGGVYWWTRSVDVDTSYLTTMLPGILLSGIGVGLALPTLISSGLSQVPPPWFATGSAVITMVRQIGFVLGVSIFIGVLGVPQTPADLHSDFVLAWDVTVASAVLAAASSLLMEIWLRRGHQKLGRHRSSRVTGSATSAKCEKCGQLRADVS